MDQEFKNQFEQVLENKTDDLIYNFEMYRNNRNLNILFNLIFIQPIPDNIQNECEEYIEKRYEDFFRYQNPSLYKDYLFSDVLRELNSDLSPAEFIEFLGQLYDIYHREVLHLARQNEHDFTIDQIENQNIINLFLYLGILDNTLNNLSNQTVFYYLLGILKFMRRTYSQLKSYSEDYFYREEFDEDNNILP